jgi:hypothetical protein
MGVAALGVMIPIVAIIGAFLMIIYLRKYQNDERMAMIEKGLGPEFLNMKVESNPSLSLRAALLFVGVGLGLLIGYFLDAHFRMEEVAYFSMVFIFGGIGLGAAYLIEEKKKLNEKNKP